MNLTLVPFKSETFTFCSSRTNPRCSQSCLSIDREANAVWLINDNQDITGAGEIVTFFKFELRSRIKLSRPSLDGAFVQRCLKG